MDDRLESRSVKKLRFLTLALIISGALNITFLVTSFFSFTEKDLLEPIVRKMSQENPAVDTHFERLLVQMNKLSFAELISYLTNRDLVGDGYTKRDLAVAMLVSFHHFNIEKALSSSHLQKRIVHISEDMDVQMFAALSDDQFEAIIRFAYEEKWPLNTEGLYKALKKNPATKDESLIQAISTTSEFRSLQTLFHKTGYYPSVSSLIHLICEGSFDLFNQFAKEQERLLDLSGARRRSLLLSYLTMQSKTAAYMLLETDFSFIARQLEDQGIVELLTLLKEKTNESEKLCIELLKSPRSDIVWEKAAEVLYTYEGEDIHSIDLQVAKAKFLSNYFLPVNEEIKDLSIGDKILAVPHRSGDTLSSQEGVLQIECKRSKVHTVKEGENLWKIARFYGVKMDDLVKINAIDKDKLFPGMVLNIPE